MKLLIVIPTYNESENIELFIKSIMDIAATLAEIEILVVDDNSPDGTAEIVKNLSSIYHGKIHLLSRESKQGCATAYLKGFSWAVQNNYEFILAMDADFSHDPKYIPQMLEAIGNNDMVIGSRNVKGGVIENRTWIRDALTKFGSIYCRILLRCPIRDITGGYNMYKKEVFEKIDIDSIQSRGYSFQIDIKYSVFKAGLKFVEIPIVFPDRKFGKSKMSGKFMFSALRDVWKIRKKKKTDSGVRQFMKFALTGGLRAIINLTLFFLFVDILDLSPTIASIICFLISTSQNYLTSHLWTFRQNTKGEKLSLKKWFFFLCGSTMGLCINIIVLIVVLYYFDLSRTKFIAQAIGLFAGMIVNFFVSKLLVFRRKK